MLKPGGSFTFTVWTPPPVSKAFELVLGAVQRHGVTGVTLPEGPPFFLYADPVAARALAEQAGFATPEIAHVAMEWEFPAAEALFDAFYHGTARTGALLRMQPPEHAERIRDALKAEMAAFRDSCGVYRVPMESVVIRARKP